MHIVTYLSMEAPAGHEWLAVWYSSRSRKGRQSVVFFGKTEDEATERAEAWMAAERAKVASKVKVRTIRTVPSKKT